MVKAIDWADAHPHSKAAKLRRKKRIVEVVTIGKGRKGKAFAKAFENALADAVLKKLGDK